jgi:hypothetical protein
MGILDYQFSQDPEKDRAIRRGLLDFGLSMLAQGGKPTSQAIGNSGLLALQGHQQREGLTERAALHKAQIGEYQSQAEQRKAQAEAMRRKAEEDAAFKRMLGGSASSGSAQAVQPAALTDWRSVGASSSAPSAGSLDYQALARAFPDRIKEIQALAEASNLGRPEVSRTVEEATPTGKQTVQFDKYGNRVGPPVAGYVAPQLVDLGDRKLFAMPKAGAMFSPGFSPSDRVSMRGQNMTDARGRETNAAMREANSINREAQQSQIINDPNLGPVIVNKGTKTATRASMDGTPIPGEETVKAGKRATQLLDAITEARTLLPGATGSGAGALYDKAGAFVGASPKGSEQASKLATLSGWMVANVPRMEGPQSNFDVQNYQQMAAQVGDSTIPVQRRLAALDTLEALQRKYQHLNGGSSAAAPGAQKASGVSTVKSDADYNALPSGAVFVGPDGKQRRKP